jgi:hypothetical protein
LKEIEGIKYVSKDYHFRINKLGRFTCEMQEEIENPKEPLKKEQRDFITNTK